MTFVEASRGIYEGTPKNITLEPSVENSSSLRYQYDSFVEVLLYSMDMTHALVLKNASGIHEPRWIGSIDGLVSVSVRSN